MNKSLETGFGQEPAEVPSAEAKKPKAQNLENRATIGLADGGNETEAMQALDTKVTEITPDKEKQLILRSAEEAVARDLAKFDAAELLSHRSEELSIQEEDLADEIQAQVDEGHRLFNTTQQAKRSKIEQVMKALDRTIEASDDENIVQKAIESLARHKEQHDALMAEKFNPETYARSSSTIKTAEDQVEQLRAQIAILENMVHEKHPS